MARDNKVYYLVNPAGAIHEVDYSHAKNRLRQLGYRMATDEEITIYRETRVQRADRPIARPWSPEPEPDVEVPDTHAEPQRRVDATDAARELADEKGVDLTTIVGTGAGGRIIKSDVEAVTSE